MRHKILYYVSITVLFALLGVVAPVPTAASPEGPRDVMVYEEDFTAYTYKDYTENAEWDIWTRSLHLALVDRIVQTNPIIVALGDGRFVVTWEDYRNSQWDIYAQRTDANGNRLWSQDVRILTDVGTFAQCSLAPDGEDGFFVAWRNAHTGDGDIFTQHLDRSGNRLWTADVRTNTDPGTAGQWRPTVSPDGSGGVFVAWGDGRNGDSDIYAQHLDGNGNRLWTADVRVNTDTGTAVQGAPGLTSCADDTICAVWQDTRNGDADVYAQRLDASGNALWTADVRVNSDSGTAAQSSPALAPDGIGGIFVAWRDMRNDSYTADIYAQRVGPVGSRLWAADVLVDSNANTGQLSDPSLVPDGSGGVFVAWGEGENGDAYAYAQRLDEVGNRVWNQDVQVGISNEGYPTVASVGTGGDFIVAWPHEAADIHTQRLNSAGNPVWSREVQVNIGTGAAAQRSPAVTPDGDGGAILLWMNSRTGTSYGVRAQRFDQNGTTAWLQSVPLIDDTGSGPFARELDIAGTGDKVVAVWGGVSAQMIDRSGNRQWPDAASVRSSAEWGHSPEVAMLSDGSALVVWMDHRNTSDLPTSPHPFDVYAQRMSPTGDRLWAQDVQVNSVVGSGNQYLYTIDVAANQANTVTVVWPDSQEGQHIMAQRIGIDGTAQWGGGRRVNIQSGFSWSPTVAVDSSGRSYVAWPEEDNYTVEIYLQALDTAGNPTWGSDVLVAEGCVPQVTVDSEDKAIVVWTSEESVYAQRFDADGSRLWDNDVLISDTGIDYWCARDGGLAATSDDLGSFFVAWGNDRNVTDDVFLKKFNLAGQAQWVEEAKAVSLDFFYSTPGSVQSHTLDTLSDDIRQATLIAEDQPWGGSVTFYLTNDGGAHWAAVTPGVTHVFTTAGSDLRWRAVLTADPLWPRTPIVRSLRIEYSTQMSYADDYEGDDTCARARPIQVNGAAQTHTFHQAGDADWAWFDVISGTTYIVETYNLGTRAQTVVEPHRTCQAPPAGTGRSFGNGYTFSFTADQTSRYYAKVYNHTPSVYGQDTDYTLSVRSVRPNAVAGRGPTPPPATPTRTTSSTLPTGRTASSSTPGWARPTCATWPHYPTTTQTAMGPTTSPRCPPRPTCATRCRTGRGGGGWSWACRCTSTWWTTGWWIGSRRMGMRSPATSRRLTSTCG
jgi:hypothetical protein